VKLTLAIVAINSWNRLTIGSRMVPCSLSTSKGSGGSDSKSR
jgi:hypothetical protein